MFFLAALLHVNRESVEEEVSNLCISSAIAFPKITAVGLASFLFESCPLVALTVMCHRVAVGNAQKGHVEVSSACQDNPTQTHAYLWAM